MPSRKPRIALTAPVELADALADLSDALGKPVATVTLELLIEIIPQIQGAAKLHRAIQTGNKATAKRAMVELMGKEMADFMSQQQAEMFKAQRRK
jgi:hypothetical protein